MRQMQEMQQQRIEHEQEIRRLREQREPSSGSGIVTNIRIKQPDTYDGRRGTVDLWVFQMQQYLLATKTKDQEQVVYITTNLLRGDAAI